MMKIVFYQDNDKNFSSKPIEKEIGEIPSTLALLINQFRKEFNNYISRIDATIEVVGITPKNGGQKTYLLTEDHYEKFINSHDINYITLIVRTVTFVHDVDSSNVTDEEHFSDVEFDWDITEPQISADSEALRVPCLANSNGMPIRKSDSSSPMIAQAALGDFLPQTSSDPLTPGTCAPAGSRKRGFRNLASLPQIAINKAIATPRRISRRIQQSIHPPEIFHLLRSGLYTPNYVRRQLTELTNSLCKTFTKAFTL